MTCYFTQPDDSAQVQLNMTINGVLFEITKRFYIQDVDTRSVYIRTIDTDYSQRIFGDRAEAVKRDASAKTLLDAEQDTMQIYNGYAFYLSDLKTVFPNLEGFHIANRKIYYRANGLWVANIDGAYPVQIDTLGCAYMTLDTKDNRIYWANSEGVWYMPFVGSDNNKFVSTPEQLNTMTNVIKLAADGEPK